MIFINPYMFGTSAVVITPMANALDGTNTTTYTFAAQSFGAAAVGRVMVVAFTAEGGVGGISIVTIGGVTAAVVGTAQNNGTTHVALYSAAVPTGTSGDVIITFANGQFRCGMALYAMIGASSATASASGNDVTGNPLQVPLNIPAGGGAIAATYVDGNQAVTWNNLTEYVDAPIESGNISYSSAYANFAAAQTALSLEATFSGSGNQLMVAGAWGP